MDSKKIDNCTYRFEENGLFFYLLIGEKKALLINGGREAEGVRSIIQTITDLPLSLLNTSSEDIHIGTNDEFPYFYSSPCDAFYYYKQKKNVGIINPLFDGDVIDLGNRELQIISFPGITPGSIVVLDKSSGVIYSGSSITNKEINLSLSVSDIHAYSASLKRLENYRQYYDIFYSSLFSGFSSPSILPLLERGAQKIIRKEIDGVEKMIKGKKVKEYKEGDITFYL